MTFLPLPQGHGSFLPTFFRVMEAVVSRIVAARKGAPMTLGDIACACALLWVDFRMPELGWRKDPALAAWIAPIEARPSFANTRPG